MREFGATRIATPDGLVLERPPLSPLEAAVAAAPPASAAASKDEPDDDVGEEQREKDLQCAWNEHWGRVGLSSGASIPPYPGPEKAQRFLGRWT